MAGSEVLTATDRETASQTFSTQVWTCTAAPSSRRSRWQCEAGRYHVNAESQWVEVDAPPGEVGESVLTGLLNRAMPLVRFRAGDLARLVSGNCP